MATNTCAVSATMDRRLLAAGIAAVILDIGISDPHVAPL